MPAATTTSMLLLPAMAAASQPSGFLGLSLDAQGVYHAPSPALNSLHADYQFLRHHAMDAGQLELPAVADFGASAHVRLSPLLRPAANGSGGAATLTLALCEVHFSFHYSTPPPRACASQPIVNNSNTAGWTSQTVQRAPPGQNPGPEWCRKLCCASAICSGWTYTDPQPNQPPGHQENDCWLQEGPTRLEPGGPMCDGSANGHCWSGLGNAAGAGSWSVELNGQPMNLSRALTSMGGLANGLPGFEQPAHTVSGNGPVASTLEIFLDGPIAQSAPNETQPGPFPLAFPSQILVLQGVLRRRRRDDNRWQLLKRRGRQGQPAAGGRGCSDRARGVADGAEPLNMNHLSTPWLSRPTSLSSSILSTS